MIYAHTNTYNYNSDLNTLHKTAHHSDKNTHWYTHLLTHCCCSHATCSHALDLAVLWCTWSPVGGDLAVIQLFNGPSHFSVFAVSPHWSNMLTPSSINQSVARLLFLRCCLGIHTTFPFPPSSSKIELPFVCFDIFSNTTLLNGFALALLFYYFFMNSVVAPAVSKFKLSLVITWFAKWRYTSR